jgi:hypothetical protein
MDMFLCAALKKKLRNAQKNIHEHQCFGETAKRLFTAKVSDHSPHFPSRQSPHCWVLHGITTFDVERVPL